MELAPFVAVEETSSNMSLLRAYTFVDSIFIANWLNDRDFTSSSDVTE